MRPALRPFLWAVAFLCAFPARADTGLVAVLPMNAPKLDKELRETLEEDIRTVAGDFLLARGYTVLTGETTLQYIEDNGLKADKVCEASCALNAARELKATLFISGSATKAEGEYVAFVRLFETKTEHQLGSLKLEGETVKALRKQFEAGAATLFRALGGPAAAPVSDAVSSAPVPEVARSGPRIHKSNATTAVGTLIVSAKPAGKVRIDLVDPNGKKSSSGSPYENKQAAPGTWTITASATGYEQEQQSSEVPADDMATVRFELKQFGSLKVTGTPVGAAVSVTGPGGFKDDGGLPWDADGLKSGRYTVKVTRTGYNEDYEAVEVKAGEQAAVNVKLEKGYSGGSSGEWVSILGGTFYMGADDLDASKPVTKVTLSPYSMGRTEVTVAAYAACVKAGTCSTAGTGPDCNWNVEGKENHPINCVDWDQAKAFCEAQGGRLPTEAEWEFGARGKDSWKYPWGDAEPNEALANWSSSNGTEPVGSHPAGASPFGLRDMAGNVSEWVEDTYANYPGGSRTNPKQESGKQCVYRGGGWSYNDAGWLRGAYRVEVIPGVRYNDLGFRCARDAR